MTRPCVSGRHAALRALTRRLPVAHTLVLSLVTGPLGLFSHWVTQAVVEEMRWLWRWYINTPTGITGADEKPEYGKAYGFSYGNKYGSDDGDTKDKVGRCMLTPGFRS